MEGGGGVAVPMAAASACCQRSKSRLFGIGQGGTVVAMPPAVCNQGKPVIARCRAIAAGMMAFVMEGSVSVGDGVCGPVIVAESSGALRAGAGGAYGAHFSFYGQAVMVFDYAQALAARQSGNIYRLENGERVWVRKAGKRIAKWRYALLGLFAHRLHLEALEPVPHPGGAR